MLSEHYLDMENNRILSEKRRCTCMENENSYETEEIKEMINNHRFHEGEALISTLMLKEPHAARPHNLMGILLEKEGKHSDAMKHFRAAYALDPSYEPAEKNLETFGAFAIDRDYDYGEEPMKETKTVQQKEHALCI
jgi:lipoprotein NlpI